NNNNNHNNQPDAETVILEFSDEPEDDDDDSDDGSDDKFHPARSVIKGKHNLTSSELELLASHHYLESYKYDCKHLTFDFTFSLAAKDKVLMIPLLEAELEKTMTRKVQGISKVFVTTDRLRSEDRNCVVTEGVNFGHVFDHSDLFDVDNLYTNDIGAVLSMYGVEAARQAIVNEVAAVFAVYGIGVDYRHLSVIADFMTVAGGFDGFNRMAIRAQNSPLLKASYETTMSFLRDAALHGESDDLKTPAARLVLGQPVGTGTGAFELYFDRLANAAAAATSSVR
ncbi:MAG: hypothetical protein Q8P67_02645, partial [archaeon]|nr:hypothetical protein [archaeon]